MGNLWRKFKVHVKDSAHTKYALSIFILLCIAGILLLLFLRASGPTEYLVISHNNAAENDGPISILNLKNGKIVKPQISGVGCTVKNETINPLQLLFYCIGNDESKNLWEVNLADSSVTPYTKLPEPYTNINVPLHPALILRESGERYFTAGGPGFIDNGDMTDAGVVVVEGNEVQKILISDRTQPYFILRVLLDEAENKLWMLSTGNGITVLIDRIDLARKEIDFSHTIESYSGYDMTMSGENIAVSTYRTNTGVDITLFDRRTGNIEEITLPVREILGFNALSMLERNGKFFVSSMDGLYVLNLETYALTEFVENNPKSQFTYLVNGADSMYAIDSYDRVYKIPDSDRLHPELLIDGDGQGLSSLYYFINK